MNKRVSVLGVEIDSLTMQQALLKVEQFILDGLPRLIVTANAEMVMLSQRDSTLAEILAGAHLVVPDGAGVVWAARHKGNIMPERVTGYDLAQNLLNLAKEKEYKVFLFGGRPEVVEAARKKALSLYPGVKIVGVRHGFFTKEEEEDIIETIIAAKPDILFVALGVPKQEKWLAKNLNALNIPACLGVGGTFDVMAGAVTRAPLWMQKNNLEWLYRLKQEPWRFIRMLALPKFVLKVIFCGKKTK